jgi:GTP 3',8-cyclase
MLDRFKRDINYLRISVTDRCNLRCVYCMPEEGIRLLAHDDILTFDEIAAFTRIAVTKGIRKVRLTGGEPLVRKGITSLVAMLSEIEGITDFSMTTNGSLLAEYAEQLKRAGLQRVNISLDTVNPQRYQEMSRTGNLADVLEGIDAALEAGLLPIKINCVIKKSESESDAAGVKNYCMSKGLDVRFIEQMDLATGHFAVVHGGEGGDCARCNRLRLTASGKLRPCLFSDEEIDIREKGYEESIKRALEIKPECGTLNEKSYFYNIGG